MKKQWVYYIGFGFILISILVTGLIVATTPHLTPALDKKPVITISVSESPQLKKTAEGTTITYAVETSRFSDDEFNLVKAEVLDKTSGEVLLKLEGTELAKWYVPVSQTSDKAGVPAVRFEVTVPPEQIPSELFSRLTFVSKAKAALPFTVTGGDVHLLAANT